LSTIGEGYGWGMRNEKFGYDKKALKGFKFLAWRENRIKISSVFDVFSIDIQAFLFIVIRFFRAFLTNILIGFFGRLGNSQICSSFVV